MSIVDADTWVEYAELCKSQERLMGCLVYVAKNVVEIPVLVLCTTTSQPTGTHGDFNGPQFAVRVDIYSNVFSMTTFVLPSQSGPRIII